MATRIHLSQYFHTLPKQQFRNVASSMCDWLNANGHTQLADAVSSANNADALQPHLNALENILTQNIDNPSADWTPNAALDELTSVGYHSNPLLGSNTTDKIAFLHTTMDRAVELDEENRFAKELKKFLEKPIQDSATLDAFLLETQGFYAGTTDSEFSTTYPQELIAVAEATAGKSLSGALYFLHMVKSGMIQGRGAAAERLIPLENAFLNGATAVWEKPPSFIGRLARLWARANNYRVHEGNISEVLDVSTRAGHDTAHAMHSRWQLIRGSPLPQVRLSEYLYMHDAEAYIFVRGWLQGHATQCAQNSDAEWIDILKGNIGTIVEYIIKTKNIDCVPDIMAALPRMVARCRDEITSQQARGNALVARAVDANMRTMINRALSSGKLDAFLDDAFDAVPTILGDIRAELARLEAAGEDYLFKVIKRNKGNIVTRALATAQLASYPPRVFAAIPKMTKAMHDKAAELRKGDERDRAHAETLWNNQRGILHHAINSAKLGKYPPRAMTAIPTIGDVLNKKIASLRLSGNHAEADIIEGNSGSIMYAALTYGKLKKYPAQVFAAIPKIARAIEDEIARLKGTGDMRAARALERNTGSIIHHAINADRLKTYHEQACEALPRILQAIDKHVANLKSEDMCAEVEAIENHTDTIISEALRSGMLDSYTERALKSISHIIPFVKRTSKEMRRTRRPRRASRIESNLSGMIAAALKHRTFDAYPPRAINALPHMLRILRKATAQFRSNGNDRLADLLSANENTIIAHAIASHKLTNYVTTVVTALPSVVLAIDSATDPRITSNRRTALTRALGAGRLSDPVGYFLSLR